jgi:zinc and cadmium transporter
MTLALIIITASVLSSLLGLAGGALVLWKEEYVRKRLSLYLVSFAAGSMLAAAFLDLLPEVLDLGLDKNIAFLFALIGMIVFFLIEKFLIWFHCHEETGCEVHSFTYLIIISDATHNFIDGILIATSFIVSIPLGIVTTIAVTAHEIPQEIGDFSILLHGGMKGNRVMFYNILAAIFSALGAILVIIFSSSVVNISLPLLAFAAGNFIYIASSDLIPAIHKEIKLKKALWQVVFMMIGMAVIWGIDKVIR